MSAPARWIRLDVSWRRSRWIRKLHPIAQLAWPALLGLVKVEGVGGEMKDMDDEVLAEELKLAGFVAYVTMMLEAAIADNAVTRRDGVLAVTNWPKYQPKDPTAAARQRKFRSERSSQANPGDDRAKKPGPVSAADPTPSPVTPLHRDVTPVTPGHTGQLRDTVTSVARDVDVDRDVDPDRTSTSPPTPQGQERGDVRSRSQNGNGDGHGEQPKLTDLVPKLNKPVRKAPDPADPVARWEPLARENLRTIRGTTDDRDVEIGGHRVGMGLEITRFRRLTAERKLDPELLARAIAYLPDVSELQAPIGLALFESVPGLLEECLGRVFRSMPVAPEVGEALRGARRRAAAPADEGERVVPIGEMRAQLEARRRQQQEKAAQAIEEARAAAAEAAAKPVGAP